MNTPEPAAGNRRTWLLTAAAAVVVAALGFGGWTALQDDNGSAQVAQQKTVMTLKGPAKPNAMAMCMRMEPDTVGQMQVAFDGTVASVDGETVTLDVTKWYAGGDTDQVQLTQLNPDTWVALEGGITLEAGQRYLVTANDGVVNGCGFTAPWTQELQDIFDAGFSG